MFCCEVKFIKLISKLVLGTTVLCVLFSCEYDVVVSRSPVTSSVVSPVSTSLGGITTNSFNLSSLLEEDIHKGSQRVLIFSITNTSDSKINSFNLSGVSSPFGFVGGVYPGLSGTCTNELASGDVCTVALTHSPEIDGLQSDTFSIVHDSSSTDIEVSVNALSFSAPTSSFTRYGTSFFQFLGGSVDGGKDIDLDGINDVVYSLGYSDVNETDEGGIDILSGVDLTSTVNDFYFRDLWGNHSSAEFGLSVKLVDDKNTNGGADILTGARGFDNLVGSSEGATYVLDGQSPSTIISDQLGTIPYARFGEKFEVLGDNNGNGFEEILIGREGWEVPGTGSWNGYVKLFDLSDLSTPMESWDEVQYRSGLGSRMTKLGDLDGDGIDDYLLSAANYDDNGANSNNGRVYVISGATRTQIRIHTGAINNASAGAAACAVDDINFDGYDDYIFSQNNSSSVRELNVYSGLDGQLINTLDIPASVTSCENMGDIDGDGFTDILVGASWYPPTYVGGAVWMLSGITFTEFFSIKSTTSDLGFGAIVFNIGDINNDSKNDFAVTSANSTGGVAYKGGIDIFFTP